MPSPIEEKRNRLTDMLRQVSDDIRRMRDDDDWDEFNLEYRKGWRDFQRTIEDFLENDREMRK